MILYITKKQLKKKKFLYSFVVIIVLQCSCARENFESFIKWKWNSMNPNVKQNMIILMKHLRLPLVFGAVCVAQSLVFLWCDLYSVGLFFFVFSFFAITYFFIRWMLSIFRNSRLIYSWIYTLQCLWRRSVIFAIYYTVAIMYKQQIITVIKFRMIGSIKLLLFSVIKQIQIVQAEYLRTIQFFKIKFLHLKIQEIKLLLTGYICKYPCWTA